MTRWMIAIALVAAASPSSAQTTRERLGRLMESPPEGIPEGALLSIQHLLDTAERIEDRYEPQAASWRRRAARYLEQVEQGVDPWVRDTNVVLNRGYRSPVSTVLQGYAIYLPEGYDPSRQYPLYVALHGGSSNGNLFLGVVLGNNMDWERYLEHLYDDFVPRWSPDWIVVAPTGFGQIMWRWMGEQDVLDVIADVQRHYSVDPDRVTLGGLSNGGVGAYAIGTRHSWRFAQVHAMAGAPSWVQYLGGMGRLDDTEEVEVLRYSGMHLLENAINTDFWYFHGRTDTGPMRPRYVEELDARVRSLGIESIHGTWLEAGHDILYRVHRHGRLYERWAERSRDRSPPEVRVVTGDYRAARQHWIEVTRIAEYPRLAKVRAVANASGIDVTTENVRAFSIDLRDAPAPAELRIRVDGATVFDDERVNAGHVLHVVKRSDGWTTGFPRDEGRHKRPGLAGPITDAYYGRMVHVFGTQNAEHTDDLRDAAERGARGWPLWSWDLKQEVVPDTECDEALMRSATVVLYGSPGDNAVLERIAGALPIRVEDGAVVVGERRFAGDDVGTRFIYPNPLAPERYVIVQAGVTPDAVKAGNGLPEFLPDYVVYDDRTIPRRQARVHARNRALMNGYFDARWRLPGAQTAANEGAGESEGWASEGWANVRAWVSSRGEVRDAGRSLATSEGAGDDQDDPPQTAFERGMLESTLPIPEAPAVPGPPRRYHAPPTDPAGRAVRAIWARIPEFRNYRAEIPGAVWRVDRRAEWHVRPQQDCYDALAESEIPARPRPALSPVVASPVEILGPVDGIWFRTTHEDQPVVMSCEMALRLPALTEVLHEHGVHGVELLSTYRNNPRTSFHTMGLAWDLSRFWTDDGWLSVQTHYERTTDHRTCSGPRPRDRRARRLRSIACDLWETRRFSTVLTPNYNEGHRDHFHVDARPDDPRLYIR